MRRYFGIAAVIVFLLAFALALWGGPDKNLFESPFSSIPSILVDYTDNGTEVYVHGLNDFKYTSISLVASCGNDTQERTRENGYFLYYVANASWPEMSLNITVWNVNKEYRFNGTIKVAQPEEAPTLLTIYEAAHGKINTYTLTTTNLPWKKLMERIR